MNFWITTDTHLGHERMVTKFKTRLPRFEEDIFKGFACIEPGDILIHLGDVAFKNESFWHSLISEIKCKKWLVLGNHDKNSLTWYLQRGWDFVGETFTLNFMGHVILFSHVPQPFTGKNYTINIHGHFHDNDHRHREPYLVAIKNERHYLLAIETNKYKLFNLKTILKNFKKVDK